MNNQARNHLNLQKHIADQDHIIRVRNAEIAALRKRAEKAEKERDHLATVLATTARQRDEADKRDAHPLTPDAITDEMVLRFMNTYDRLNDGSKDAPSLNHFTAARTFLTRRALTAALTPARPEGAEEIEAYMRELVTSHPEDHYGELADHLASRGVLPPLTDKTHPEEQS